MGAQSSHVASEPHLDALAIVSACIELGPISRSDDPERGEIGLPLSLNTRYQARIAALNAQKSKPSDRKGQSLHKKVNLCDILQKGKFGGAKRDRTADLLHAMQALSQLSYSPNLRDRRGGAKRRFRVGWRLVTVDFRPMQAPKNQSPEKNRPGPIFRRTCLKQTPFPQPQNQNAGSKTRRRFIFNNRRQRS